MAPISYSYDVIGNLTSKSDFANSYSYPSARPNAVNSVALVGSGTANYGYDANGNMTTAQGNGNSQAAQDVGELALKYDPYNKPFFIERNGKRSEFWYGPDDQRYFQLENGNQRTVYIGKLYEQIGSTVHKLYLGDYAVFTVDVTSAANSGINYLHKDRLGSIVSITDESGNLIANAGRSFDPFGKPREEDLADSDGITHAPMPDTIGDLNRPDITTRGFTGHEQLNNLSLTHMNGRIYDYNLGRFLSVDPYIAFPEDSQSLNPYSYLLNNPLSGTDPSGYLPSICGQGLVSRCEGGATAYLNGQRGDAAVADFRSNKSEFTVTVTYDNGVQIQFDFTRTGPDGGLVSNASVLVPDSLGGQGDSYFGLPVKDMASLQGALIFGVGDGFFASPGLENSYAFLHLAACAAGGCEALLGIGGAVITYSVGDAAADAIGRAYDNASSSDDNPSQGGNQQDLKNLGGTGSPTGPDLDPDEDNTVEVNGVRLFTNRRPSDPIQQPRTFTNTDIIHVRYNGRLNYVVTEKGRLVLGKTGHTSLVNGGRVQAAGEVKFVNGQVRFINNKSGHYRPYGTSARKAAEDAFRREGFEPNGKYKEIY